MKAAIGYTGTVAIGRAAIEYYEDGPRWASSPTPCCAARDKGGAGRREAQKAQATGAKAMDAVRDRRRAAQAAGGCAMPPSRASLRQSPLILPLKQTEEETSLMTDLWPRLEPLLAAAERARYLNHEFGCVYKPETGLPLLHGVSRYHELQGRRTRRCASS
ncbi:MAG: hypothetical protein ACLTMP_10755 [Eggerthella lenta]